MERNILRDWVPNHHNLSTIKVQIILNTQKSLEHMMSARDIPRDFTRKNTPPASPAPNLLAIFESEIPEGGKLLQYFERFSARPTNHTIHTIHDILLVHCICPLHNGHIRINLFKCLFHDKSK
jgi:hypothetical protein